MGVFDRSPRWSGSTVGISKTSTAARHVGLANNGWASLQVVLKDSTTDSRDWTVRLLSGGGTPSSNQSLPGTGYIGFWMKTSTAPSGAEVSLLVDDAPGGTEQAAKLSVINDGNWHLYQWNLTGSGWTSFFGGNGIINGPTVTLDALMFYAANNSPDWTLYIDDVSYNNAGPLPVQLANFAASVVAGAVHLTWRTVSEVSNYGFEVQRRLMNNREMSGWEAAGFVPGNGTTAQPIHYEFIDRPDAGPVSVVQYRLRQINTDGSFSFSDIVEVFFQRQPTAFRLDQNYPNPFNPETEISFTVAGDGPVRLSVFDLLGREIAVLFDGEASVGFMYRVKFEAHGLSSGVYLYRLQLPHQQLVRKMMVVK